LSKITVCENIPDEEKEFQELVGEFNKAFKQINNIVLGTNIYAYLLMRLISALGN
jgi:hypothetical protein